MSHLGQPLPFTVCDPVRPQPQLRHSSKKPRKTVLLSCLTTWRFTPLEFIFPQDCPQDSGTICLRLGWAYKENILCFFRLSGIKIRIYRTPIEPRYFCPVSVKQAFVQLFPLPLHTDLGHRTPSEPCCFSLLIGITYPSSYLFLAITAHCGCPCPFITSCSEKPANQNRCPIPLFHAPL